MKKTDKRRCIIIAASKRARTSLASVTKEFVRLSNESNRPIRVFVDGVHVSSKLQEGLTSLFQANALGGSRPKIITSIYGMPSGAAVGILLSGDKVIADSTSVIILTSDVFDPVSLRLLASKVFQRLLNIYLECQEELPRFRRDAEMSLPNYDQHLRNAMIDLPAFICGICLKLNPELRYKPLRALGLTYLEYLSDEVRDRLSTGNSIPIKTKPPRSVDYDLTRIIAHALPHLFSKRDCQLIKRAHRFKGNSETSCRLVETSHAANQPFLPLWRFSQFLIETLAASIHGFTGSEAKWLGLVDETLN